MKIIEYKIVRSPHSVSEFWKTLDLEALALPLDLDLTTGAISLSSDSWKTLDLEALALPLDLDLAALGMRSPPSNPFSWT